MNEIIKIERFLKIYENTFENQRWQIEIEGYSRLNEFNLHVDSDFGDYPNLIGFETEVLTIDKNLIYEKLKSINSICDKMIDDFDFIMSNRNDLQHRIGQTNFYSHYFVPINIQNNTKELKFNDNNLICTIYNIKSIIENQLQNPLLSKFDSDLSNDCLVNIMILLMKEKKGLEQTNSDLWLYHFNRKPYDNPTPLTWNGTPSMLTNVIQSICVPNSEYGKAIKSVFDRNKVPATADKFKTTKIGKAINQLKTIDQQK